MPLFPEANRVVLWVEVLPRNIMRILRVQPWYEGAGHSAMGTQAVFCFPLSREALGSVYCVQGCGAEPEAGAG